MKAPTEPFHLLTVQLPLFFQNQGHNTLALWAYSSNTRRVRQIGNAMPVPLGQALCAGALS